MSTSNVFLSGNTTPQKKIDKPKIFFFPHSGSGPGMYMNWGEHLDEFELIGVQYPGRGSRMGEDFSETLEELVESLFKDANPELFSGTYFFFGHSLGAIVAFELAKKITAYHINPPKTIIVSALPSPNSSSFKDRVRAVEESEFITMIDGFSKEMKEEFLKNADLRELYIDIINADIALLGTRSSAENDKLNINLQVFGGIDDSIDISSLETWREHTSSKFSMHIFKGAHFYYLSHFKEFINKLKQIILT